MRRHRRHAVSSEEVGLQIAPMIDVTMLLLFFFMLSTTLKDPKAAPEIKVPVTKSLPESVPGKVTVIVAVSQTGETTVNGRSTRDAELSAEIARHANTKGTAKLVAAIHADARTDGLTIRKIVAACQANGVSEVTYAVENNSP